MVEAPGGRAPLQVLAGGPEDPQGVAAVERAGGREGRAATLVRTPVQDLVVGIAWNRNVIFSEQWKIDEDGVTN